MAYSIVLGADARRHIRYLLHQGIMSRGEHSRLINAMAVRLAYQPATAAGSVRALRQPNALNVAFELHVPPWRALYNVDIAARNVRIEGREIDL